MSVRRHDLGERMKPGCTKKSADLLSVGGCYITHVRTATHTRRHVAGAWKYTRCCGDGAAKHSKESGLHDQSEV
jgi:hypothetical protein